MYMYVYIYVCMYVYVHFRSCACVCVCVCVSMYVYICMCMFLLAFVCLSYYSLFVPKSLFACLTVHLLIQRLYFRDCLLSI